MKKIIYFISCLLLTVLMISCSSLFESEKTPSILVPLPGAKSRAAVPSFVEYYEIEVSQEGDDPVGEHVPLIKKGYPGEVVSFYDLKEGDYYVEVSAYKYGPVLEGGYKQNFLSSGDLVTVVKGKTATVKITLSMSADISEDAQTLLYSGRNIWDLYATKDLEDAESPSKNLCEFDEYVFDSHGNLYVITEENGLVRYSKVEKNGEYVITSFTLMDNENEEYKTFLQKSVYDLAYDLEKEDLYIITENSEEINYRVISNANNNYYYNIGDDKNFGGYYAPKVAVFGGFTYIVDKSLENLELFIERKGNSLDGKYVELKDILKKALPDYSDDLMDQIKVTDIAANINGVYLLIRQWGGFNFQEGYDCYSRGAIINLDDNLNFKSISGWTSGVTKDYYTNDSSNHWLQYAPATPGSQLYGPVRFIAVKPKKLVFADDGACVLDYKDGDKVSDVFKQINRVVEYDMEQKTFTNIYDVNASFSYNLSYSCGFNGEGTKIYSKF